MTKKLIRLRDCAGWPAHLLLTCNKIRFSRGDPDLFIWNLCVKTRYNSLIDWVEFYQTSQK